jgi:hypothetical protein
VALRVDHVAPSGCSMYRATIRQKKTGGPVRSTRSLRFRSWSAALIASPIARGLHARFWNTTRAVRPPPHHPLTPHAPACQNARRPCVVRDRESARQCRGTGRMG